jgi:hypothetical protein
MKTEKDVIVGSIAFPVPIEIECQECHQKATYVTRHKAKDGTRWDLYRCDNEHVTEIPVQ